MQMAADYKDPIVKNPDGSSKLSETFYKKAKAEVNNFYMLWTRQRLE